ncbi:MAG: carbohydrate kinase family protein [Anaerolineae bacterium]|nr:carbohydrate kinase family protein [Anaerolineae bacterium]
MTKILVAGELNADLVMTGLPSLPVLGQELIGDGFKQVMGSSSAITAARLASLGADVDFAGVVGKDDLGSFVLDQLQGFGVNVGHVQRIDVPTGVTIALTYSHDRALLTFPGTIEAYDGSDLTTERLSQYDHVHVGAYFLQTGLQPHLARIFKLAQEQGVTTSLDVGWDPSETWMDNPYLLAVLDYSDYFVPNEDEVTALMGGSYQPQRLAEKVKGTLLVKRGGEGAAAYDKSGELARVPSYHVEVVDTTGAGDAFNAGFLYARIVESLSLEEAMKFAAGCGAQAVTQVGGATNAPTAQAVHKLMNTWQSRE